MIHGASTVAIGNGHLPSSGHQLPCYRCRLSKAWISGELASR